MRIYAVSDMHGNLDGLNPSGCDICVIAGDFAKMYGFGKWHVVKQRKWVEKRFIGWIQAFPDVEFVIVPGNHDLFADPKFSAVLPDASFSVTWPSNAHFLINSGCSVKGVSFWGSPNVPIISYRWAFESEHDKLVETFSSIPENTDVLVTHSPPHVSGKFVDYSLQVSSGPFGSAELTDAIVTKKPQYVFCGHIHSGSHGMTEFESTRIYNVSRVDERYEIAYEPATIEL